MKVTNLSQLKNYLQEGMILELVATSLPRHKALGVKRAIIKKQTNAIKFEGGSWLGLGSTGEKASDFTFQDNGFTVFTDRNTEQEDFLRYEYR